MAINVWTVDKTDDEGYHYFVDLCETYDEAVEAVFSDWAEGSGYKRAHTWLTEPEANEYAPERGFYIYEYRPTTTFAGLVENNRISYTYYIYHFTKGNTAEDNEMDAECFRYEGE